MPIVGFVRQRLARLGKIRLGKKALSAKGSEYPSDLPHFVVPEEVAAVYGDEPTALDVMVPCADVDKFFPIELQRWGAGEKLLCRGDGEKALCWSDEAGGWQEQPCGYQECPFFGAGSGKGCTERGTLMVFLPSVSLSGVYQIDTGSFYGTNNVYNEFTTFQTMLTNLTGNPELIRAVKFRLTREAQTINYFDGTTRKSVTKALLHLRAPNISEEQALQLSARFGASSNAPRLSDGSLLPVPELEPADHDSLPALPPVADLPEGVLEEAPQGLVPGASPVGPDLGQKNAWAALLEQVAGLGKNADVFEKSVCRNVNPEAVRFDDLDGMDEAPLAVQQAVAMIEQWQKTTETSPEPAASAAVRQPRKATQAKATF